MRLQTKKEVNTLALLFSLTYMISYITRINYGAIISEMEEATQISRSLLSMALMGSFITYGAGQIISGLCGDRFSPKKLVSYGLITTVFMNLLITVCQNPWQMLIVWCVNGFAQAFMWPPLVKLMTTLLSDEDYKKTTVKVSWGSSLGTIAVYLASPLIISTFGWKAVFLFSAICGAFMIFVWNKYSYDIETECVDIAGNREEKTSAGGLFAPLLVCIMLAIILMGMLRDGVTTWMPSYISETYNMSNSISILTGVILPLFSILCSQIAIKLYINIFKNPLSCAGVFFAFGVISAIGIYMFSGQNAAVSVLLSAILVGSMHGANLMLTCMVPPFFIRNGNVSTVTGLLNCCTYIGSAVFTYGIALLSERLGWSYTIFLWCLIAAAGTAICFLCVKPWKRKMAEQ